MENQLIVTDIPVSGADPKMWVRRNGKLYLLKFSKEGNALMPYIEYVASRFLQQVGLPVQTVELVTYNNKLGALCGDIGDVKQFQGIGESSLDTDKADKLYVLEDILYEILHMSKLSVRQKLALHHNFKMLLLCDAVLANRDRHSGNWGYYENGEMCPVYDNGACLFPSVQNYQEATLKRFFYRLVIEAPRSKVQRYNSSGKPKRNSFYHLLENESGLEPELRIARGWDVPDILDYALIGVPSPLREFYKQLITLRYECIIRRESFEVVYERYCRYGVNAIQSVSYLIEWISNLQVD